VAVNCPAGILTCQARKTENLSVTSDYSLRHNVQTGSCAHQESYSIGIGLFSWGKIGLNLSPATLPSSVEIKNQRTCTSISGHVPPPFLYDFLHVQVRPYFNGIECGFVG